MRRTVGRIAQRIHRDLRLALRTLRRRPGFAIAAVLILGLGIGMSTAMFAVCRAVLIERLPVADQDRLVVMHPLDRGGAHLDAPFPYLQVMRRDTSVLRAVAGVYHQGGMAHPVVSGDAIVSMTTGYASANFFDVLGTRPYLGRLFRASDGEVGAPLALVLSYNGWRRLFHGDPSVIGRAVLEPANRTPIRIVGVAPPGLDYPVGTDGWTQLTADFPYQVDIIARLTPPATASTARTWLFDLSKRVNVFESEHRTDLPQVSGVEVGSFAHEILGDARPVIVALTGAVGLLLLIACVNVGNLVLVHIGGRVREIAVRRALGASLGDIVHQFAVEHTLLGIAGGALGFACAKALLRVLLLLAPAELPRTDVIRITGVPLGIAVATTALAVLLFGILPSLTAARNASYGPLRADDRSGRSTSTQRRARRALVVAQMALALVLLAGAALLGRSLDHLLRVRLGYDPEQVSLLQFTGPAALFASGASTQRVADDVVKRFESVPGVTAASVVENAPFKGQNFYIAKPARAELSPRERARTPYTPFEAAGPDYFRVLRIPIVRGRAFSPGDTRSAPQVAIVSEMLARRMWPNEDPIGKRLRDVYDTTGTLITVVGVAADTHFRTLREAAPVIYFAFDQFDPPWWTGMIAVRTAGPLERVLPSLRAAARDVRPRLTIWNARTMDEYLDGPLAQPRLSALLLSSFSGVALLLAAIGLYAVMSAFVRQQSRDIGVRIALGATGGDVRRLVLGEALSVVALGALVGLVGAAAGARVLSSLLYDVRPTDPLSLVAASLLLALVGAAAAYFPAYRASRIDPMLSLRAE